MFVKILLFGSTGQVGSECRRVFAGLEGFEVICIKRVQADFTRPQTVYQAIYDVKPDWVVNACAYTAVDHAESEPELARLVNAESVELMGKACAELNTPVLHLSTDYVFNGESHLPYNENNRVDPLGVYGATKLAGEKALQRMHSQHVVLRTSWVFSGHGNNFVKTMLRVGAQRDELSVVNDQLGCPTFAGDIAAVIAQLIVTFCRDEGAPWGIYHCSNAGSCSWYQFAQSIFQVGESLGAINSPPKLIAIPSSDYPTPVKRPAFSVLDCHKLEQFLAKPMPHWRQGLEQTITALKDRECDRESH